MRVDAQPPAGDVDVVDAVVAHVAGAEVVPPVPAVMDAVGLEGHHRRGPDPQVVVEAVGLRPGGRGRCSVRRWLFQTLATSTSPIAPSRSSSIASITAGELRLCVPTCTTRLLRARPRPSAALRECCASRASRRTRACRRRRPGSWPARANGRAWPRTRRRPICRRAPCRMSATIRGALPVALSTTCAAAAARGRLRDRRRKPPPRRAARRTTCSRFFAWPPQPIQPITILSCALSAGWLLSPSYRRPRASYRVWAAAKAAAPSAGLLEKIATIVVGHGRFSRMRWRGFSSERGQTARMQNERHGVRSLRSA